MWALILFGIMAILLFHEKAERKKEEKDYNNGICPKCGAWMCTLEDNWGNTTGFGCKKCGHRTSDRYIGSDMAHYRNKNNK